MATRRKPYDPSHSAAERKARDQEAARMIAQGATVRRDRGGHIISAWRSNVFNILLARETITLDHHNAAERLAKEWRTWKGLDGKPEPRMEVVNGSSELEEAETGFVSAQRREAAGAKVARMMAPLSRGSRHLLVGFMVATVEEDRPMEWRGIVQRHLGITVRDRQTKAVADALEELRLVVQGPRREAA